VVVIDLIEYCGEVGSFRNTTIEGPINGIPVGCAWLYRNQQRRLRITDRWSGGVGSRSTRFLTSKCCTVIVGTPAFSQSVPETRQKSSSRSGTLRPAAIVSVVGKAVGIDVLDHLSVEDEVL
jgi:hypothetical protein